MSSAEGQATSKTLSREEAIQLASELLSEHKISSYDIEEKLRAAARTKHQEQFNNFCIALNEALCAGDWNKVAPSKNKFTQSLIASMYAHQEDAVRRFGLTLYLHKKNPKIALVTATGHSRGYLQWFIQTDSTTSKRGHGHPFDYLVNDTFNPGANAKVSVKNLLKKIKQTCIKNYTEQKDYLEYAKSRIELYKVLVGEK